MNIKLIKNHLHENIERNANALNEIGAEISEHEIAKSHNELDEMEDEDLSNNILLYLFIKGASDKVGN